jgi:general secretion pathway protein G
MHAIRRTNKGGFTLVEILIVVIILGILAAIVIPQFTNASQDARKNSLTSQLQTIRSQVELYKLQHQDNLPNLGGSGANTGWDLLTQKTTSAGTVDTTGTCGPYLQQVPINPLNSNSAIVDGDGSAAPAAGNGWVYDYGSGAGTGKFWATGIVDTKYFNEPDPSGSDLATAP